MISSKINPILVVDLENGWILKGGVVSQKSLLQKGLAWLVVIFQINNKENKINKHTIR